MSSIKIQLLLVENPRFYSKSFIYLLEGRISNYIVDAAVNLTDAISKADNNNYEIVFINLGLEELHASTLIHHLKRCSPVSKIVAILEENNTRITHKVLEMEVDAIILKNITIDELKKCIEDLRDSGKNVTSKLESTSIPSSNIAQVKYITKTEQLVLNHICEGKSTKMCANLLNRSENTILSHRKNLFRKFNVHSVVELVTQARHHGLI